MAFFKKMNTMFRRGSVKGGTNNNNNNNQGPPQEDAMSASDRQPKMAVWSAKDYVVHKAGRVASQGGETPFSSQNQSPADDRFARAPKVGDFKVGDSNQAYKNNRQAADQLQRRTQASEAGACIFGR